MTYHQSSAVSVATVVTAATVIMIGYRVGRAHAAWRDLRAAKRDVPAKRKIAWGHTRPLLLGALFLLATMVAAAYDAGH
ncbi:hypothetical protein Asp14428_64300 [Actinoplanes sp. NBRC 14428]|uniref:Uncharacterized protein n=1 Tax=Pseudosporangium ferrugineum TaxID=439699 RepID=A0A2T0RU33_9ACTN|nr:hypothetical protein CLV70_113143 [Pseudosporangium ferrugineum]BCJ54955.1 hypothetical protein Asp14428_64300 [Actinoplanes sp. NBRC 14428]